MEFVEHSPFFVVDCQVFNRDVLFLKRNQSAVTCGRIHSVGIQWTSLLLVLTEAIVWPSQNECAPSDIVQLQDEATTDKDSPSAISRAQELHFGPINANEGPSYQTVPPIEYSHALRERAEELFGTVSQQIGHKAKKYKGSFSIFATSFGETVAKIVIYQRGLGRENGPWPMLPDGVYVLVRCNGSAQRFLWQADVLKSNPYCPRLDLRRTLAIAPKHSERFAYFRIEPEDEMRTVANLLVLCSSI